jgi:hypothetical protein
MFIGLVPMMFAIAIIIAVISFARTHPGQTGGSDAFLLIALLLLGYFTNLILAVPARYGRGSSPAATSISAPLPRWSCASWSWWP